MPRQMLSIKQACEVLAMGQTKLREIIKTDPTFPAYMICGRWKIDAEKLNFWIECHRAGAAVKRSIIQPKRGRPKKTPPKRVYEVITPGWNKEGA